MSESDSSLLPAHPDCLFIGGSWVAPSAPAFIDVVQPATEDVFLRVAQAGEADADLAVAVAREAFDHGPWPSLRHAERAQYLRRMAEALKRRVAAAAHLWTSQTGLTHSLASLVSAGNPAILEGYAELADSFPFMERHEPQAGGKIGLLVREPVGVVLAIVPWNAPLPLALHKAAPALLAGCAVIIKASPEAPGDVLLIAEAAEEAGLPAGVINVLTADREVSERLVRNPGVNKVTFTGSTAAGRRIGAICAERVARVTLELGGKSAAVVLNDYDIQSAAEALAMTPRFLSGQACAAVTRVIVSRDRHDAMVEALAAVYKDLRVGDPFDPVSEVGPLAMARQRDRVEAYIAKGREQGAVVATGGERPAHLDRGFYIQPTVFGHVTNDMVIAREEIFGPVIAVIAADSDEHAIDIANDSDYGLNASVYTNDIDRAFEISRRILSGTVGHNGTRGDFSIAFGGFKQSGIGREGGREGVLPFTETKTIILDGVPTQFA